jgi:energy-converting hydrogenase Eha subunit C
LRLTIVRICTVASSFNKRVTYHHLHVVLTVEGDDERAKQQPCADWPWSRDPYGKGAEEQAWRPQPHVNSRVVFFLCERLHQLVLDERQHDVIQAAGQAADEEARGILNGTSFEVEAKRTDDSSEDEVMKVVIWCAVEADKVVYVNGWNHVGGVQVEASAHTLQKGKRGGECECCSTTILLVNYLQRIHDGKNLQNTVLAMHVWTGSGAAANNSWRKYAQAGRWLAQYH